MYKIREAEIKFKYNDCKEIYFNSPANVYDWFKDELENADREKCFAVYLDNKNRVLCFNIVAIGGLDYASVDPKNIFRVALLCGCNSIIIIHNHPSGSLKPSKEDIALNGSLEGCCKLLGFNLLDFIIISNEGYFSFKENQ